MLPMGDGSGNLPPPQPHYMSDPTRNESHLPSGGGGEGEGETPEVGSRRSIIHLCPDAITDDRIDRSRWHTGIPIGQVVPTVVASGGAGNGGLCECFPGAYRKDHGEDTCASCVIACFHDVDRCGSRLVCVMDKGRV